MCEEPEYEPVDPTALPPTVPLSPAGVGIMALVAAAMDLMSGRLFRHSPCGHHVPLGSKFCPGCGGPIDWNTMKPPEAP